MKIQHIMKKQLSICAFSFIAISSIQAGEKAPLAVLSQKMTFVQLKNSGETLLLQLELLRSQRKKQQMQLKLLIHLSLALFYSNQHW